MKPVARTLSFSAAGVLFATFLALGSHACTPAGQQLVGNLANIACNVIPVFVPNPTTKEYVGAVCDDAADIVTNVINAVVSSQKTSLIAVRAEEAKYTPVTLKGRPVGSVRAELAAEVQKRLDAVK